MANYDAEVRVSTKVDTSQMQRLQMQIDKAAMKVEALTKKCEDLKNQQVPTEAFTALESKLQSAQAELQKLNDEKAKFVSLGFGEEMIAGTNRQISEAQRNVESITAEMQKMKDSGTAFTGIDPEKIRESENELYLAKGNLSALVMKMDELIAKQDATVRKSRSVSDGLKRIGDIGKKAFSRMNSHAKKSSGLFHTMATRLKGILLSLLIFNWITKGFNNMVNGMKKGFKNLVLYSEEYNKSVSALKSANTQLQNSWAAAFMPIVQAAIPHLITLINCLTSAANSVAQFSAVITGKSTWIKATAVQEDYAASLDGTAASAKKAVKALASFDTLEVLNKKDSGGSGGVNPKDMFEEVPVEQSGRYKDFADKVASSLNKIKDSAKNLLASLEKLWNEGFSQLKDFTFDTLLDFYNHFLVPVGSWTLGEGLPRFFDITNNLLKSINWGLLQRRLRDFYDLLAKIAKCVFDSLLDFYEYFLAPVASWTMNKALPTLLKTLTDLGNKVSWDLINHSLEILYKVLSKFAVGIGNGLILFWNGIEPILTSSIAFIINSIALSLETMLGAIDMIPEDVLIALGGAIAGFLSAFVLYKSVTGIMSAVGAAFGALCDSITSGIALVAANPYAVAVAGIGALLGAMIALDQKASERLQIEEYGQTLDTLCANINNRTEAVKNQSNAIKGYVDDTGAAELALADDLATKYYELSEKEGLTNDEKSEMKSLSERLVELIPELADSVNSETGAISAQKDEVYNLIEAKREQYRVEAAKEKMIEAYQNQLDAEQNLKEAIDYATEAQERYNEKLEEYNQTQAKIQENPAEWSYLADQMDEMGLTVADAKSNWQDLVKEVDAATKAFDDTQETINYLETVMENGGKNCTEGFVNGYDTDSMVGTVRDSAEQCIEAFREANDSHSPSKVYESLGKDTVDGFVLGISDNTPNAVAAMQALCEQLKVTFTESFLAGWTESFSTWFEENGSMFFAYDVWYEQFENIMLAYIDVNSEFMSEWQANMDTWWNTMVIPFFAVEQWKLFGTNMKTGIIQGFKVIINEICGLLNQIISMFDAAFSQLEDSMNDLIDSYNDSASALGTSTLSRVHYKPMGGIKIPELANGAVIRGGNPFLAILGDQRSGQTNVETPLSTIEEAVSNVMSRQNTGSAPSSINLYIDSEKVAQVTLDSFLSEMNRRGYDLDPIGE